uniref:LigB domain-containing protein n=1 Tax=Panagrellus redivivus TaxID=6233 RepID=A0A7E4UR28_PANRE
MTKPTSTRLPVYFLSHGGPTFMYRDGAGGQPDAWDFINGLGKHILNDIKPKTILVVSAHWASGDETSDAGYTYSPAKGATAIQIAHGPDADGNHKLIYDFSNFPAHMYKEKFPSKPNLKLAKNVKSTLAASGIESEIVDRGIDHGVWVPFKVAFPDGLGDIPLIQVSLFNSEDPERHYKLGAALAPLRDQGVLIVTSGMSVHNLLFRRNPGPFKFSAEFDELLKDAVEAQEGQDRLNALTHLLTLPVARDAHPTYEHILPIHVAAGAAFDDKAKRLFTAVSGSLAWGEYIFGDDVKGGVCSVA